MLVRQAKAIVRQWIAAEASRMPGFQGAFFHGSINGLEDEDSLPVASDVDVIVVIDGPALPEKLGKLLHQGVIIDISYLPQDQIHSAEKVLGLSYLAGSLLSSSLISDPTGHLSALQAAVSTDYAKRGWVVRRCAQAREKVLAHLHGLSQAEPFHDQVNHWLFGAGVTTHILLAAGLKNPTVRKRYLAARELLAQYHRIDFYNTLLEMLGCAQMSQARVSEHLAALASVFDAASTAIHTPFPFAADISALARPVAVGGSRELIERGDHREAVFWIAVTYARCQKVLYHDAAPEVQERYTPGFRALLADLGIRSFADLQKRSQQVRDELPQVWQVAEAIMAANPEIE